MFKQIKWITMKTYHIKKEEDIFKILENNKKITKNLTNAFEIVVKDMKKCTNQRRNGLGMDMVRFKTDMVPLTIKKGNILMVKGQKKNYDIFFVNVKNNDKDNFSTLVNNFDPNDRILIINGNEFYYDITGYTKDSSIVTIQSERNSKVIHFKFSDSVLEKMKPLYQNNLSKLSGPGVYSLFGNITKIIKYSDDDLQRMLLRIQCCDKSCIETHKYPHYVYSFKDIPKEESKFGIKFDLHSNQVDILVEAPCNEFLTLLLNQRIFLNNVKVNFSDSLNMYSLHVSGVLENLEASPTNTGIVNSLVPHRRHYKIPNELKPYTQHKTNQETSNCEYSNLNSFQRLDKNNQLPRLTDNLSSSCNALVPYRGHNVSNELNPIPQYNTKERSSKGVSNKLNRFQGLHQNDKLSDTSSDDFVSSLPPRLKQSSKVCDDNINRKRGIEMLSSTPIKKNKINANCQNFSEVLPNSLSNEIILAKQQDKSPEKQNSLDLFTDHSCSPPFLTSVNPNENITQTVDNIVEFTSNSNSTKCIGSCRLIFIEPDILHDYQKFQIQDFIRGYCPKCYSFLPICALIKSNFHEIFYCTKCEDAIHRTFFFKMIFLYGNNDRLAMEVCCYSDNAKQVLKKLTEKKITLQNYLANRNCIVDNLRSLIRNKTRVNIIVTESLIDNAHILLDIDTKCVTSPIK